MRCIGNKARKVLSSLLESENYKGCLCDGYYKEGSQYIAFDNTSANCNVEEFECVEDAIKWLNHEYANPDNFKGETSVY